jgi:integrase
LRRGFATTAADNGASLRQIRDQLRHEHDETTEIYIARRPLPFDQSLTPLILP